MIRSDRNVFEPSYLACSCCINIEGDKGGWTLPLRPDTGITRTVSLPSTFKSLVDIRIPTLYCLYAYTAQVEIGKNIPVSKI